MKNKYPHEDEIVFDFKNGQELTRLYLKSDVNLVAYVFKTFVKVCIKEYGFIPLYCVSLPGYSYQCAQKHTDIKLQTLQDKDLILLLKTNLRGGISSVKGIRYVKWDDIKKIRCIDATNLYGH